MYQKIKQGLVVLQYVDDPDDTDEYKIVGSQEADPFEGRISNESPIAKALMNHKLGDVITVESPNGNYEVEITAIKQQFFTIYLDNDILLLY